MKHCIAISREVVLPKPRAFEPWLDDVKLARLKDGHGLTADWGVYYWLSLFEKKLSTIALPFSLELLITKAIPIGTL